MNPLELISYLIIGLTFLMLLLTIVRMITGFFARNAPESTPSADTAKADLAVTPTASAVSETGIPAEIIAAISAALAVWQGVHPEPTPTTAGFRFRRARRV